MITNEGQWRHAIHGELIRSNEVHVLRAFLDLTTIQKEGLLAVLSSDEVARAERFHFARDQNRFIAARGTLRKILGRYLEENPSKLRFEYTPHGKPIIATNSGYDTLSFNLSHSGPFALYAVTRGRNIGIDIEHIRDNVDVGQMAQGFFSQSEIRSLEQTPQNNRSELFFKYWTRKEAFIKATGEGISFPMERCDVSLITGNNISPIIIPGDNKDSVGWYGRDLFPGSGYAAAIAVEGADWDLDCMYYSG